MSEVRTYVSTAGSITHTSNRHKYGLTLVAVFCILPSVQAMADSQFSNKAVATISSCSDAEISGFATLKERASDEGIKEIEVYLQVNGLGDSQRAVHLHETAACTACGAAGGHFDPGNAGVSSPDANHPFHSGDLPQIKSRNDVAVGTSVTSRVTLASGPLSLLDDDGSAFIVHDNADSYCQGGEAAGCAGGSRAACGIITPVNLSDDFDILVSTRQKRDRATELSNAELSAEAFVFLSPLYPTEAVTSVEFFIDGQTAKIETGAPFDLAGTRSDGKAASFDTRQLAEGTHTLSAIINLSSGEQSFVSSVFRVDNDNRTFSNGQANQ